MVKNPRVLLCIVRWNVMQGVVWRLVDGRSCLSIAHQLRTINGFNLSLNRAHIGSSLNSTLASSRPCELARSARPKVHPKAATGYNVDDYARNGARPLKTI